MSGNHQPTKMAIGYYPMTGAAVLAWACDTCQPTAQMSWPCQYVPEAERYRKLPDLEPRRFDSKEALKNLNALFTSWDTDNLSTAEYRRRTEELLDEAARALRW